MSDLFLFPGGLSRSAADDRRAASAGCLLNGYGVHPLPVSWDHARMPRVRLLDRCAVRRLPVSWDAPRHAPLGCLLDVCGVCPLPDGGGRMSGSAGRAPRPSLPVRGHVQGVRCVRHGTGGKVLPGRGTR